jgi:hypothetical protein
MSSFTAAEDDPPAALLAAGAVDPGAEADDESADVDFDDDEQAVATRATQPTAINPDDFKAFSFTSSPSNGQVTCRDVYFSKLEIFDTNIPRIERVSRVL